MRRPTLGEVRAGLWGLRARRAARRALRSDPLSAPPIPAPPPLPGEAGRGVDVALTRLRTSCLERAAVRQVWLAAHGDRRDLVIGVRRPDEFAAHAWLEGDTGAAGDGYVELVRRPSA